MTSKSQPLLPTVRWLLLMSFGAMAALPAAAEETNVLARDPSTIIERAGTYWVYGTGRGVRQFSSSDRIHWTEQRHVFTDAPMWIADAVPQNHRNGVWAPDVHLIGDKYFLYYSYSSMGSEVSAIGVATNSTLDPSTWQDQGVVIQSTGGSGFNTIDPCIFQDAAGKPWLSFGSYFDGIHLIEIDPATGKRLRPDSPIYNLASRPGTPNNAIEASAVYYHDGYYYLFVNWDSCCAGAKSTYNIRMGRSKVVTGPYLDKKGKSLAEGGGSMFMPTDLKDESGQAAHEEIGAGHVGILHDSAGFWVSTHYEWAQDKYGATTMNVDKLEWDPDGWPRAPQTPK